MIFNILFGILLFLFAYEMYFKDKTNIKEYLVPERNPWPKGCSRSQNNIATNQSHKIDNLEHKNTLLSNNLDLDYVETLIRERFLFGRKDETIYIIKKNDNKN